jgi:transposase
MNAFTLLPTGEGIHVEKITSGADTLLIHLVTTAPEVACPACGQLSLHLHSRYQRTLADLPWNRVAVRIQVQARKFFCDRTHCPRRIFTEPLPELAARYARKTNRLQSALYLIGYALGGEAGARVAVGLGLSVSPDTLLQRVRQVSACSAVSKPVRVLGVDDWAFRKGHHYGTILVDLEQHRPLELLSDREAESLSDWLKAHPEVEIISRDRACAYSEGAHTGAPHATQVADRWHLLRNVAETLDERLGKEARVIREAAYAVQPTPDGRHAPTYNERLKQAAHHKRQDRYTRLQELLVEHPQMSRLEIAKRVGISRATVYKWQSLETLPPRKGMPRRERLIDPFTHYLHRRWSEGCHNGAQLLREIQEQGFTGTKNMLTHLLRDWRVPLREQKAQKRRWVPSPRAVKWLLLKPPEKRRAQEQAFVEELLQRAPTISKAQQLVLSFFTLLRKEGQQTLDEWLTAAQESGLAELEQCVKGLNKDKAALVAAVELPYSNGQTEGQVNRLKLIKRSMYGRAKLDLLQARVLPMRQAA